jgi:cell division protein FtsZ
MFELEELIDTRARIKVIGVGGGGGNAVNSMIMSGITGVDFIAINTDTQDLSLSLAPHKLQIGARVTKGLGAGSNPELGRAAAMEDSSRIEEILKGADMVFITAGMGGGTGTGGAPVVAAIAKELGILTVGIVTKPFFYEGKRRIENAQKGIEELKKNVDSIIVIPNDRIRLVAEKGMSLRGAFELVNDVLRQAIQGITDLILKPGLINLDFADVRTILMNSGRAVMGIGSASGRNSGLEAARRAVTNPLIENTDITGARRVLLNITGGPDMEMESVNEACSFIYDTVHNDVHLIFGAIIDEAMGDSIRITIIATDYPETRDSMEKGSVEERPEKGPSEKRQLQELKKEVLENSTITSTPQTITFTTTSSHNKDIQRRGAQRVLSKALDSFDLPRELFQYDDPVDLPAFMRKRVEAQQEIEEGHDES